MVKRTSSRLSLVTIDHEIPLDERLPDDTILVGGADGAVIEGILNTSCRTFLPKITVVCSASPPAIHSLPG